MHPFPDSLEEFTTHTQWATATSLVRDRPPHTSNDGVMLLDPVRSGFSPDDRVLASWSNSRHHPGNPEGVDYATLVAQLAVGGEYNYFLRTITSYIREHLDERLTVDQIAEAIHMNRSYLSTKFKKETGRSLSSYVIDTKLKKSMEYLRNTDKPIIEIVNLLGFSSQGYFQNVFKRHIGITPGQYRERD